MCCWMSGVSMHYTKQEYLFSQLWVHKWAIISDLPLLFLTICLILSPVPLTHSFTPAHPALAGKQQGSLFIAYKSPQYTNHCQKKKKESAINSIQIYSILNLPWFFSYIIFPVTAKQSKKISFIFLSIIMEINSTFWHLFAFSFILN